MDATKQNKENILQSLQRELLIETVNYFNFHGRIPDAYPVRVHPDTIDWLVANDPHGILYDRIRATIAGHPILVCCKTQPGEFYILPLFKNVGGQIRFEGGPFHAHVYYAPKWGRQAELTLGCAKHVYNLCWLHSGRSATYATYLYSHAEPVTPILAN